MRVRAHFDDGLGKEKEADELASAYFMPAESVGVAVRMMRDRIHVLRSYHVTVYRDEWQVLTPLFLPYMCAVGDLHKLVPKDKRFRFDESDVRSELQRFGVLPQNEDYLVDILARIGAISYGRPVSSSNKKLDFRLFRIDPLDGIFWQQKLEGKTREPYAPADES